MTEPSHWRKIRAISFSSEDNSRLERLKLRAERFMIEPSYSQLIRVALCHLEKEGDWKLRAALEAVPKTRYGREPKEPRPRLSEDELTALRKKLGLS